MISKIQENTLRNGVIYPAWAKNLFGVLRRIRSKELLMIASSMMALPGKVCLLVDLSS